MISDILRYHYLQLFMTSSQVDIVNIVLLLLSLVLAAILPFELFLFSYAILGPLHYLTELNWLKQKKFFTKARLRWVSVLIALTILFCITPALALFDYFDSISLQNSLEFIDQWSDVYLLIAFCFGVCLFLWNSHIHLLAALILCATSAILSNYVISEKVILIGVFLPTLIHVYIFTFFFILYGSLKSSSRSGYFLAILLLMVPVLLACTPLNGELYYPGEFTIENYNYSTMVSIGAELADLFGLIRYEEYDVYSSLGYKIQVFIAFAYTYHYLNWFSKTTVIGWWRALNSKSAIVVGIMWIAAVGIYVYDFALGFEVLFFLSTLHVFLEFPLNAATIKESFNQLFRRI